jgi:hypothetical protein
MLSHFLLKSLTHSSKPVLCGGCSDNQRHWPHETSHQICHTNSTGNDKSVKNRELEFRIGLTQLTCTAATSSPCLYSDSRVKVKGKVKWPQNRGIHRASWEDGSPNLPLGIIPQNNPRYQVLHHFRTTSGFPSKEHGQRIVIWTWSLRCFQHCHL